MPVPTAASSAGCAFSDDPLPVFNVLPGAFLLLSPALVIEAVSNAFLTETLTTRADIVGRSLFDVFPDNPEAPDTHAVSSMRGALLQVLATGTACELPRQRYDVPDPAHPGRFVERHWQPCNTPVLDAEGRVTHILHDAVNVTERVRAEARLGESRAREQSANADADAQRLRLHNILLELPANVATHLGPDHVFGFVNPHYQALFPTRVLRGRAVREALPELVGQGFFRQLDHVYQTGEPFYGTEMETWADFTHTGQLDRRYMSVFFQAQRDENGVIDGVLNFSYDVTELVVGRQHAEQTRLQVQGLNQELRASNAELEQKVGDRTHALLITLNQLERRSRDLALALTAEQKLGEMKSRFVSMASHEFRTPLAIILTSAELIGDYPGGEQQPQRLKHVQRIQASVQHLNDILEEFLSVGRIEEGKIEARPANLNLTTLVHDTVADMQSLRKVGQTIDWQVECPIPVRLDASLLRKILVNLLSNALKYSGENTVVTLRASCQLQELTVSVQDQGVGISEEDQTHLFEQFYRARNVSTLAGTGLGLFIVAKYLELMGGTIDLRSELRVGTTATIVLPLTTPD